AARPGGRRPRPGGGALRAGRRRARGAPRGDGRGRAAPATRRPLRHGARRGAGRGGSRDRRPCGAGGRGHPTGPRRTASDGRRAATDACTGRPTNRDRLGRVSSVHDVTDANTWGPGIDEAVNAISRGGLVVLPTD